MSWFFMFKRLIGMVVQPVGVVALLALAALLLSRRERWRRAAWWCAAAAAAVLLFSAFPPAARMAARTLERGPTPLKTPDGEAPFAIVVLGSGVAHPGDAALPALTRLNDPARARLAEGVRLSRIFPGARLVVTGYGMGLENCGDAMAEAAMELGVAEERIDRLAHSLDTGHEAKLVKELVGDGKVVLVTSAAHMPRSLALFRERGIDATPSPCDYIAPVSDAVLRQVNWRRWRPQAKGLSDSEDVWHEFMGLAYARWLRGSPED